MCITIVHVISSKEEEKLHLMCFNPQRNFRHHLEIMAMLFFLCFYFFSSSVSFHFIDTRFNNAKYNKKTNCI